MALLLAGLQGSLYADELPGWVREHGSIQIQVDGAPSIDFLSPDIYFPDFVDRARRFAWPGNPSLIPEANRRALRKHLPMPCLPSVN